MRLSRVAAIFSLALAAVAASAQSAADLRITDARSVALGGTHTALADGFETLFANPAGLLDVEPSLLFSQLTVRAAGPVFSLAGVVMQGLGGTDFATLLGSSAVQQLLSSIYAKFSLAGPLAFGYVGSGMGFGVYNDTQFLLSSTGAATIEARLGERFVIRGGYGIGIPLPESWNSRLAVGLGLKGFTRGDAIIATSLLTLPSVFASLGPSLLTGAPFELTSGIGIDAGVRFVWSDLLAGAITVNDLYTPATVLSYDTLAGFLDSSATPSAPSYSQLPQELNFGLAYTPSLGVVDRYVQNLKVLFDYSDALDFWLDPARAENFILKMGLGVEATFLEVLSVRAGFAQGLFAAGLGIDLTYVKLDAAMFGSELSTEPGLRPVYNLIIGLEFRG